VELIPVLDARDGRAVHAAGGDRSRYLQLKSVLVEGCDPLLVGRAFREKLRLSRLYLADLKAIESRGKELAGALALVRGLAAEGLGVWVDAGVSEVDEAGRLLHAGAAAVVIGLETLPELGALRLLARELDSEKIVFSLDMRGGRPLSRNPTIAALTPEQIAREAVHSGFGTLIALELARVGERAGPDHERLRTLQYAAPGATWVAGGGIRGLGDLQRLADCGYAACLAATALHDGRIGTRELAAIAGFGVPGFGNRWRDRAPEAAASRISTQVIHDSHQGPEVELLPNQAPEVRSPDQAPESSSR
jgi:phosphoribosylformimino-5-aminoimidazole carboxamide ribotide isomerase